MPHKAKADDASLTGDQDNYDFTFTVSLDIPLPIEVAVGPCEEFQGARHRDGYGKKWMKGKTLLAHRAAWINAHGPIAAIAANRSLRQSSPTSAIGPAPILLAPPPSDFSRRPSPGTARRKRGAGL